MRLNASWRLNLGLSQRGHIDQHVRAQVQGLDADLRDQSVYLVRKRLLCSLSWNARQTCSWPKADVARRISSLDQAIPERLALQPGLLRREDRFEGLSRTVLEVDCRVLGLRSRTGHSISAREPGQELVYCASDE